MTCHGLKMDARKVAIWMQREIGPSNFNSRASRISPKDWRDQLWRKLRDRREMGMSARMNRVLSLSVSFGRVGFTWPSLRKRKTMRKKSLLNEAETSSFARNADNVPTGSR